MNKFALAALGISAVAAHPHPNHKHHEGHDYGFDHKLLGNVNEMIFDYNTENVQECKLKDGDRLPDTVFYRELMQGVFNSSVKGWYHEDTERPISEDCFGDWMDAEISKIHNIVKKGHDDFWSVTLSDATNVATTAINMHYKNMDACKFEKIGDDAKHWCVENPETCLGLNGMWDRVIENSAPLFSKGMDLYDLVMTDDICYSDSELITEAERAIQDVTSMLSLIRGYDIKWDQTRQTHIKKRDFRKEIHELKKSLDINIWDELLNIPSLDQMLDMLKDIQLPKLGDLMEILHQIGLV